MLLSPIPHGRYGSESCVPKSPHGWEVPALPPCAVTLVPRAGRLLSCVF